MKNISTDLEVGERLVNMKYFHRMSNIGATKIKRAALHDISKECGKEKFYSINYVCRESEVIEKLKYDFQFVQI